MTTTSKITTIAIEALNDIAHGARTPHHNETIKCLMRCAEDALKDAANVNLEAAGAWGRTIERWWTGFYGNYTPAQTALMTASEIAAIITQGSRRG